MYSKGSSSQAINVEGPVNRRDIEENCKKKETNLIESIATGGKKYSYPLNESRYNRRQTDQRNIKDQKENWQSCQEHIAHPCSVYRPRHTTSAEHRCPSIRLAERKEK